MKVYEGIPQGTAEWNALRSGIPTASQAHRIITPSLKASSQQEKYRFQLLAERLMLEPVTEAPKGFWWAERGKELEADAIAFYDLTKNTESRPIAFVTAWEGRIGASPDRFVGDPGMAEFKCENEADHLMYLLQDGSLYQEHKLQVQFQLLVCEDKEWNDLCAYHPKLPPAVHRTYRDKEIQSALRSGLTAFLEKLEQSWQVCIERGWTKEKNSGGEGKRARGGNLGAPLPKLEDLVKSALLEVEAKKKVLA